jgi:Protein of unknown function (DUF2530)
LLTVNGGVAFRQAVSTANGRLPLAGALQVHHAGSRLPAWTSLAGVRSPSRPSPPPLEGNDELITGVITAGWAAALVVVLILREKIPASERWWIWTCAAGLAIGLFGLFYIPRVKRARSRPARGSAEAGPG